MLVRHEKRAIVWYSFEALDKLGFLRNWVTTRQGGDPTAGFTFSANNDGKGVAAENLRTASELFTGGRKILLPRQVHGTDVHILARNLEERPTADGVVVTGSNLPAGVLTADCLPIILADTSRRKAAIVHAGRKGVFQNIISTSIRSLGATPENLVAAIGPGIRSCCYEVKEDVFEGEFSKFRKYFGGGRLDFVKAVHDQLLDAGLSPENINDCGICTSCRVSEFYSHRKEKGEAGRFMTGIMLVR